MSATVASLLAGWGQSDGRLQTAKNADVADAMAIDQRELFALKCPVSENSKTGGHLLVQTPAGRVRIHRPRIYQHDLGRPREIVGAYRLTAATSPALQVAFEISEYHPSLPLFIDPILEYTSYLGGSGFDGLGAVALDGQGNAYVARPGR